MGEAAVAAARRKAIELNTQMCIAVVDSGGELKAFHRMDDAWVGSIDIAIKKAKTFGRVVNGDLLAAKGAILGRPILVPRLRIFEGSAETSNVRISTA